MDKIIFRNSVMNKLGLMQKEQKNSSSFDLDLDLDLTQKENPSFFRSSIFSKLKTAGRISEIAGGVTGAITTSPLELKAGKERYVEAKPAASAAAQRGLSILTRKIGEGTAKIAETLNLPGQLVEFITKGKYQAPKLDPVVFNSISETLEEKSEKNLELSRVLQQSGIQIQDSRAFSEKIQDRKFIAEGLGGNLPNFIMSLGVGIVGTVVGGPEVGAVAGFSSGATLEGGYAYNDAKTFLEESEDPKLRALANDKDYLEKIAIQVGIVNGLLEVAPITKILKRNPLGNQVKKRIFTKIMNRILAQAGLEGGTESIQEIVSNVVAQEYDKERETFQGVGEAGFFGALMGGGISTVADLPTITKDIKPGLTIEDVSGELQKRKEAGKEMGEEIDKEVNPDGTLTLYYGTSKQKADYYLKKGRINKNSLLNFIEKEESEGGEEGEGIGALDYAKREFGEEATVMKIKVDVRGLLNTHSGLISLPALKEENGIWKAVIEEKPIEKITPVSRTTSELATKAQEFIKKGKWSDDLWKTLPKLWHRAPTNIRTYSKKQLVDNPDFFGKGFYLYGNADEAGIPGKYGRRSFSVDIKNPYVIQNKDLEKLESQWEDDPASFVKKLKKEGFDSIKVMKEDGSIKIAMVFDVSQVQTKEQVRKIWREEEAKTANKITSVQK